MTFRSLLSGEDDELKGAYDAFHKAMQHERRVETIATLVSVEQLRLDASTAYLNIEDGLAATQHLQSDTTTLLAETSKINNSINSEIVFTHSRSTVSKNIDRSGDQSGAHKRSDLAVYSQIHGDSRDCFRQAL